MDASLPLISFSTPSFWTDAANNPSGNKRSCIVTCFVVPNKQASDQSLVVPIVLATGWLVRFGSVRFDTTVTDCASVVVSVLVGLVRDRRDRWAVRYIVSSVPYSIMCVLPISLCERACLLGLVRDTLWLDGRDAKFLTAFHLDAHSLMKLGPFLCNSQEVSTIRPLSHASVIIE